MMTDISLSRRTTKWKSSTKRSATQMRRTTWVRRALPMHIMDPSYSRSWSPTYWNVDTNSLTCRWYSEMILSNIWQEATLPKKKWGNQRLPATHWTHNRHSFDESSLEHTKCLLSTSSEMLIFRPQWHSTQLIFFVLVDHSLDVSL